LQQQLAGLAAEPLDEAVELEASLLFSRRKGVVQPRKCSKHVFFFCKKNWNFSREQWNLTLSNQQRLGFPFFFPKKKCPKERQEN
jgi:hypothetical protein